MDKLKIKNKHITIYSTIIFLCIIIIFSVFINTLSVNAEKDKKRTLSVNVIKIESGDTLWDLAKKHLNDEMDIREYVNQIKKTNNIESDTIHEGRYLIIPTYCDQSQ